MAKATRPRREFSHRLPESAHYWHVHARPPRTSLPTSSSSKHTLLLVTQGTSLPFTKQQFCTVRHSCALVFRSSLRSPSKEAPKAPANEARHRCARGKIDKQVQYRSSRSSTLQATNTSLRAAQRCLVAVCQASTSNCMTYTSARLQHVAGLTQAAQLH